MTSFKYTSDEWNRHWAQIAARLHVENPQEFVPIDEGTSGHYGRMVLGGFQPRMTRNGTTVNVRRMYEGEARAEVRITKNGAEVPNHLLPRLARRRAKNRVARLSRRANRG